jgi:hypothetical protein
MRMFRLAREKTLGTHNFGEYQLHVCELSTTKGSKRKGIAVVASDSVVEVPFELSEAEGKGFASFLTKVADGNVPSKHSLGKGWASLLFNLYFEFARIESDSVKGSISMNGSTRWVTIRLRSLRACAQQLEALYGDA